jgi:cobyrinic acid a,c-diamide synthase
MPSKTIPSFIVSGTSSGSGKTTVALGLMAAFRQLGYVVQPFKCGPDFIDPGLHQLVTGVVSRNLDPWMCGEDFTRKCYATHMRDGEVAIIEGVMGMFDGGMSSSGSLSRLLELPGILVLDVRSMAESAAAIVKGFETLDPAAAPVGVILNRVASDRHLQLVSDAIKSHCKAEILGHLPRSIDFSIPSRHLGLLTGDEAPISEHALRLLGESVREHIDLQRLISLSQKPLPGKPVLPHAPDDKPCRIAIARDKAFCFYYEDNFDLLRAAGAELVFFSPLRDRAVYAECGGFMYLTRGINSLEDTYHSLVGAFPVSASMQKTRASLGYREVETLAPCCFGPPGTVLRGHEFHYSRIDTMPESIARIYRVNNGTTEGYAYRKVLGGYMHLHFGFAPQVAEEFINYCRE